MIEVMRIKRLKLSTHHIRLAIDLAIVSAITHTATCSRPPRHFRVNANEKRRLISQCIPVVDYPLR